MALAAGVAFLGMVVLVLGSVFQWGGASMVVGVGAAVLGTLLVGLTWVAAGRRGLTATVADQGLVLTAGGQTTTQDWASMRAVTMGANSLTLKRVDGEDLAIVVPPGSDSRQLDALAHALAKRLDADRGYTNF